MNWFVLALISPVLFAITNHIDKTLLSKYFDEDGVSSLLIFSAIASAIVLPFLFVFDGDIFSIGLTEKAILTIAALLNVALIWLYLLALEESDASIVIVFYQLVPVFGALLGYAFLGEQLSFEQIGAMAVVIFGAGLASVEIGSTEPFRVRKRTVYCMVGASFCWAASSTIFKVAALEVNVVRALFWEHLMLVVIGLLIFLLAPRYRASFLTAFRGRSVGIISLNLTNEALYILGNVSAAFAYMLVPVSLVLLVETAQPIFVFMIGLLLIVVLPRFATEQFTRRDFIQKFVAIIVTFSGTYWLLMAT